jgi:hypothetical protein
VGGIDPLASASSVQFADSLSGKSCPASAANWTTLGLTAPTSLWLLQESGAGNRADSIGARTFVPSGIGFGHAVAVPGWTRAATVIAEAQTGNYAATIGNANTTDFLMLLYVATATPAAVRHIIEHPAIYAEINTTPRFRAEAATIATGTVDPGTTVHALVLKNWIGNSRGLLTEAEVLEPTEFATAGTTLTLGGTGSNGASIAAVYGAMWEGVTARMSNATIKTMLQTLGWSVAW